MEQSLEPQSEPSLEPSPTALNPPVPAAAVRRAARNQSLDPAAAPAGPQRPNPRHTAYPSEGSEFRGGTLNQTQEEPPPNPAVRRRVTRNPPSEPAAAPEDHQELNPGPNPAPAEGIEPGIDVPMAQNQEEPPPVSPPNQRQQNPPGNPASPARSAAGSGGDGWNPSDTEGFEGDADDLTDAFLARGLSATTAQSVHLVPHCWAREELEAYLGDESFGPIVLAIEASLESEATIIHMVQQKLACPGATVRLIPLDNDAEREVDNEWRTTGPKEAVITLHRIAHTTLKLLLEGEVVLYRDDPPQGIFCPPRLEENWTEGVITIRILQLLPLERSPPPSRDQLFEAVRAAITEALVTLTVNKELFITDQGWVAKKGDVKVWNSRTVQPLLAYERWKHRQRTQGRFFTEHNVYPVLKLTDSSYSCQSYVNGRITRDFKGNPIRNTVEVRFPIVLTEHIAEAAERVIPTILGDNFGVVVHAPMFTNKALKMLEGPDVSAEDATRGSLHRGISPNLNNVLAKKGIFSFFNVSFLGEVKIVHCLK